MTKEVTVARYISQRLKEARTNRFVGREHERSLFSAALGEEEFPFYVLYIFGPGGVGKTMLLEQFVAIAHRHQVLCPHVDGRSIEPTPEAFVYRMQQCLNLQPAESVLDILHSGSSKFVLIIDTYEMLAPLDDWLRDVFLPQLPDNVLTVIAGRNAPTSNWKVDAGWQTLIRAVPLRNLSPDETRQYLEQRNVPKQQYEAVEQFTRGHPLALSLVADTIDQNREASFQFEQNPEIVKTLLEKLVQKVPSAAHRAALEVCALVQLTTESLLKEMLAMPDVHELFEWLQNLSFIERGNTGVFPHDLVRDTLITDLRWRNPDWYAELHRRAREYYKKQMQLTRGEEQRLALVDYVFLHRLNPLIRPAIQWREHGRLLSDTAKESDIADLVAMVEQHEGKESAKIAERYFISSFKNPSVVTIVLRNGKKEIAGFLLYLCLEEMTKADEERDPGLHAVMNFLRRKAPLRQGERGLLFRYWMARENYQAMSPIQSRIFTSVVQYYFSTPALAFSFVPAASRELWTPLLTYAEIPPIPEADFECGGKRYAIFGHDWRTMPLAQWLEILGQKEMGLEPNVAPPKSVEEVIVLSESGFASAIRDALREFKRRDVLRSNPLLHSRLVLDKAGVDSTDDERVTTLVEAITSAAESLQSSPRESKFYRALYRTYINPAESQELAAESLGLPFSTYRRYLKSGIQRITEILWQIEVGRFDK
ncbi:MAG: ATP-binding protein [Bacteroidota bacterium]|nr:ATP-binding protein [Bacteroidota bacterium]